jgi:hypothetical protein
MALRLGLVVHNIALHDPIDLDGGIMNSTVDLVGQECLGSRNFESSVVILTHNI